ncbi:MAG TPA: MoaD/ThiS family protein [Thermodesulfobacteriota bacterium]|nr:MoaD/ThiS family protein [Thermodesulfobacteriota bacterium]
MRINLKLFPPLSDTARTAELPVELEDAATLGTIIDHLVNRYGPGMKQHFFDDRGRIIPSWAFFVNRKIVPFNQPGALAVAVAAGDEVSIILNIAGG